MNIAHLPRTQQILQILQGPQHLGPDHEVYVLARDRHLGRAAGYGPLPGIHPGVRPGFGWPPVGNRWRDSHIAPFGYQQQELPTR